jgi:hypothetical protein
MRKAKLDSQQQEDFCTHVESVVLEFYPHADPQQLKAHSERSFKRGESVSKAVASLIAKQPQPSEEK